MLKRISLLFTNFPDRLDEVLGDDAVDGRKRAAVLAAGANAVCREG